MPVLRFPCKRDSCKRDEEKALAFASTLICITELIYRMTEISSEIINRNIMIYSIILLLGYAGLALVLAIYLIFSHKFPRLVKHRDLLALGFMILFYIMKKYTVPPLLESEETIINPYWNGAIDHCYLLVTILVCKTQRSSVLITLIAAIYTLCKNIQTTEDACQAIRYVGVVLACILVICRNEIFSKQTSTILKETGNIFKKTANVATDLVLTVDSNRKIKYCNDAVKNLLQSELTLSNFSSLYSDLKVISLLDEKPRQNIETDTVYTRDTPRISLADKIRKYENEIIEELLSKISSEHSTLESVVELLLENEIRCRRLQKNALSIPFLRLSCRNQGITNQVELYFTERHVQGSILMIVHMNLDESQKLDVSSISHIIHELRGPISGCMAAIECAICTADTPKEVVDTMLNPAFNGLKMLHNLVNDLLDSAQIEANTLKLAFLRTDVSAVIKEAASIVRNMVTQKELNLTIVVPTDSLWITTDPNRLMQVLMNLLTNAIKFTKVGGITIQAEYFNKNPSLVKVRVIDTGIGIKSKDIERFFKDKFTKIHLEGTNQRMNPTGCGLGLNIANKLAKALGRGEIDGLKIESEVDKGSCFSFVLEDKEYQPQSKNDFQIQLAVLESQDLESIDQSQTSEKPKNINETGSTPQLQGLKILVSNEINTMGILNASTSKYREMSDSPFTQSVSSTDALKFHRRDTKARTLMLDFHKDESEVIVVDDDPFNVDALRLILRSVGYKCSVFYDGLELINYLRRCFYFNPKTTSKSTKIIFIDSNMPNMGGAETIKSIRESYSKMSYLNIILIGVTGNNDEKTKKDFEEAGANEIIFKPVSKDVIEKAVKRYLK